MNAKLRMYTRRAGKRWPRAEKSDPAGALRLRAVIVMMTAITPSLNASSRLVPRGSAPGCGLSAPVTSTALPIGASGNHWSADTGPTGSATPLL